MLLFGASFGVLARSAGFDPVASIVMSATTFAGSAQFAVVSVFAAGGTVVAAIAAAVLLNARYGPMGLAAARSFRGGAARRVAESQLLVDESWAVSQEGGRFDIRRMLGAGLVLYAGWVGGTVIGVVAGGTLGDPATLGLDAAFPALFLALLVPLVRNRRAVRRRARGRRHRAASHSADARRRAGDRRHLRRPLRPAARARRAPRAGAGRAAARDLERGAVVSAAWTAVLVVGLATVAIKAAGPGARG